MFWNPREFSIIAGVIKLALGIGKAAMVGVGEGDIRDGIAMLWQISHLILLSHH